MAGLKGFASFDPTGPGFGGWIMIAFAGIPVMVVILSLRGRPMAGVWPGSGQSQTLTPTALCREVFVSGADGGNRRRLTRQLRFASSVSWVDNNTVTYISENAVWQVDIGGTPQRLHRSPFGHAAARSGSPEVAAVSEVQVSTGGWYAICSSPVCVPATQLYLLQPGAADVQMTDRRDLAFSQPAWRPDGQALAAGCISAAAVGLCEVTRQGNVERLATVALGSRVAPAYAPDGTSIIYVHGHRRPRMRILDVATKRWRPLRDGADPAWRPVPR